MIMRRLGKRTGTAQRRNGDTLRKPPHWQSGRAAGEADGVPAGAAKACPRTQRKEPRRHTTSGLPEVRRRPTLPTGVSVPSARAGLTALFGMGRGGTPRLKPPRISLERSQRDNDN